MDKIKENVFEDAITTAFKPSIKSNRKFLAPQTGISESKKTLSDGHLCKKANQIRKDIVEVAIRNGAGHIAPSLSCVDILTALYYRIMNISRYPQWEERDRLIFSKAHGCYGLYAILADIGYIKREDWENFYKGSFLSGCVERSLENGIEASCGSLGHGLPIAVGIAFGAKLQNKSYRVYCIVGDGEMQEGSNWEAVQFAVTVPRPGAKWTSSSRPQGAGSRASKSRPRQPSRARTSRASMLSPRPQGSVSQTAR